MDAEFKQYIVVIKRNLLIITVFSFVALLSALFFSLNKERLFQVSLPIFVSSAAELSQSLKAEEPYYGVKASDGAAEAVVAWLQSASAQKMLKDKGIFFSDFKVIKFAPQFLEVKFSVKNTEDGLKINEQVLAQADLVVNYLGKSKMFELREEEPVILQEQSNAAVSVILGLFVGMFLGIFAAFLREYLKF